MIRGYVWVLHINYDYRQRYTRYSSHCCVSVDIFLRSWAICYFFLLYKSIIISICNRYSIFAMKLTHLPTSYNFFLHLHNSASTWISIIEVSCWGQEGIFFFFFIFPFTYFSLLAERTFPLFFNRLSSFAKKIAFGIKEAQFWFFKTLFLLDTEENFKVMCTSKSDN